MSKKTKDRILDAAKPLFNKEGYGAPSLYQLSQQLGMSRGNLCYYFKDKEALLDSIIEEMWIGYEKLMANTTQHPSWESTNNSTLAFHELQQEYAFIFFDKQLLNLPKIKEQIKRLRTKHIEWQMSIINFSIQIENMKGETFNGCYHNLCRTIWTTSFFWLMSDIYKSDKAEKDWGRYVWSLILPHFTTKGINSFKKHFGKNYFNSLGRPFQEFTPSFF